mgnify:CR=1 FL=1
MTVSISDIRTSPIGEDLTTEELRLSVVRGIETMFRIDYALADASTELLLGEWGCLNAQGKVERPGAVPVKNTFICWAGTERYDVKATGQVTLIAHSNIVAKTSRYDDTQSYVVGDDLTVKDLGGGEAGVTKAAGAEVVLARVLEVGTNFLTISILGSVA